MTRNSSNFMKFLNSEPITLFSDTLEGSSTDLDMATSPLSSAPTYADARPIDPTDCAETLTEGVLRRSTRLSKPTKRLIKEI